MGDAMFVQYVGPYGRGHHKAYTEIGEVCYLQVIEIPEDKFEFLNKDEWRTVEDVCRHIDLGGNICANLRDGDGLYCSTHAKEFNERAESLRDAFESTQSEVLSENFQV